MALFLSFTPFILMMILRRFLAARTTLLISAGLSLANLLWQTAMGGNVKSLNILICTLLILLTVVSFIRPALIEQRSGMVIYGVLVLFVFGGIALGQPFTLAYAREQAPEIFWSNPIFYQTSLYISLVWGGSFILLFLLSLPRGQAWLPPTIRSLLMLAIFMGAATFTNWYPIKVREQAARTSSSQVQPDIGVNLRAMPS